MIRKIQWFAMAVAAVLCAACDAHIDVPDTAVRPGHILCEDGTALSYAQYEQSGKRAIAVVFDTERREGTEGNGYAVYLWDIAPVAFADSLGVAQGTSADIGALDGNMNTFSLYDTRETASPMAEAVFDLWRYGQSAYIPSVAQMRLLVLDIDGSVRTRDGESMALLHRKRCDAGDPEDTGTQGEADYHTEQVGTKRGKVQRQWKKAKNYKGSTRYSVRSSISPC